jgi:DNA-binding NarL/FixJ family response regulator
MLQYSQPKAMKNTNGHSSGARKLAAELTGREIEIIRMIARGLRNKEIGESFLITEGAVKIHLHNIYTKLGLSSRLALALYALDKNMV